jgi:hypothetical protein
MGQTKKIDTPLSGGIDDYLRGFRAKSATVDGSDAGGDASLEEYLLERAARELKAARNRVDVVERRTVRE